MSYIVFFCPRPFFFVRYRLYIIVCAKSHEADERYILHSGMHAELPLSDRSIAAPLHVFRLSVEVDEVTLDSRGTACIIYICIYAQQVHYGKKVVRLEPLLRAQKPQHVNSSILRMRCATSVVPLMRSFSLSLCALYILYITVGEVYTNSRCMRRGAQH